MTAKESLRLEELLEHAEVKKITSPINREVIERCEYVPPKCAVFSSPYTVLAEDKRYRFDIDREARRQLPDIINNKVQTISGLSDPQAERFWQQIAAEHAGGGDAGDAPRVQTELSTRNLSLASASEPRGIRGE